MTVDTAARLVFNGIDATTGSYLLPPMSPTQLSAMALSLPSDAAELSALRASRHRALESFFGVKEGIDPTRLAEAGWGAIFSHDADPNIREALVPLLDHRRRQAAERDERLYREFAGDRGYRPGESKQAFLGRQGVGPGSVDPALVPYYLLIVADPGTIPFGFQYQLDVQYAVGRIHFDEVVDYSRYAESVVDVESHGARRRRLTLFGARHEDDRATVLSADELVVPLADTMRRELEGWDVEHIVGAGATKERLGELLGNGESPAVLFTATHGVGFPNGDPAQLRRQGALLCQEWAGPLSPAPLSGAEYLSADDIGEAADVRGLVAFHFACFGAGTPRWDEFDHSGRSQRTALAPAPFIAALPKRLLSHPNGGAIAIIGHVERAWGYSFLWPDVGRQTETFRSSLLRLAKGHPLGSAIEFFNERYAELASDLGVMLEDIHFGKATDENALAALWTASNDARGFTIVGDPAVRIVGNGASSERARGGVAVRVASADPPKPTAVGTDDGSSRLPVEAVDFGLFDGMRDLRARLADALRAVGESLAGVLERAVENVNVVEVATYVSDDPSAVTWDRDADRFDGAQLRLLSRSALDGDTHHVIPADRGAYDEALWSLHTGLIAQARAARLDLLRSAGAVISGLFDVTKGA